MAAKEFGEAQREMKSVLASAERKCLGWLAARLPSWIGSDHLTLLALAAMLASGLSYYASRFHRVALAGAVLGLAVNWFGDSLDGTLARVRGHQRPRYGFYVDHVVDCFGVFFLLSGLALSGFMSPLIAAGLLVAYFMLSIEVYLATYCLAVFRMSFWGIGPTELRILLAIGTAALWLDPRPEILGVRYRLFDVGGAVAIVSLAVTLLVSAARNTRLLYLAEPLPGRSRESRLLQRQPDAGPAFQGGPPAADADSTLQIVRGA
ncbi:MAG: CDP-alcohol phosphatidyltransferase family protein [Acidobacteriota bacterium]